MIRCLWIAVAVICTLATVARLGARRLRLRQPPGDLNGFAAGALLVMLIDSMIPEATQEDRPPAGLVTVLGFAVAFSLS